MLSNFREFHLMIAGYRFCFTSVSEPDALAFEQLYEHFLVPSGEPADLTLRVQHGIPGFLNQKMAVFSASYEYGLGKALHYDWNIQVHDKQTFICCHLPEHSQQAFWVCRINPGNTWDIYVSEVRTILGKVCLDALPYPAGPLLMYYFFTMNHALLLHASGIYDPVCRQGFIFSGVSGTGKTTISGIFANAGAEMINDDRLVLKSQGGITTMYNNPLYMKDLPRNSRVNAIFLLKQAKENYMVPVKGAMALSRLMAFCIQHHHDKGLIENMTGALLQVIKQVPVYELGFLPDENIVRFVRDRIG